MSSEGTLHRLQDHAPSTETFRQAVLATLGAPRKWLHCKFFYDERGSQLFDRICELPEYYPTRTECGLLERSAPEMAQHIGAEAEIVEFGSGAGIKIRLLLRALEAPLAYVPVDISREHLVQAAADLASDFPRLRIAPVCADYTQRFALPAIAGLKPRRVCGFFPGSTIGNFTPTEAAAFLTRARRLLGRDSLMLVGVDLVKPEPILRAAYNDAAGVTAAFNMNLLLRINRELDGTFDLESFRHDARWNAGLGRIEMHLVSTRDQTVTVAGQPFQFAAGETIHTENSYKYRIDQFRSLAAEAGYAHEAVWTDAQDLFSVHLLRG